MSLTALPAVSDHTPSQGLAPPSLPLFLNVWKGQQCVISGRKLNPSVLVGGNKQRAKKTLVLFGTEGEDPKRWIIMIIILTVMIM